MLQLEVRNQGGAFSIEDKKRGEGYGLFDGSMQVSHRYKNVNVNISKDWRIVNQFVRREEETRH